LILSYDVRHQIPSPKLCPFKTQNSLWHSSTKLYYTSSNSKPRKSTKYWKGTDHSDKFLKSESVSKIVVQTHSPANPLNGEPNNRLAEIHESMLLLRLESGTFEVTGSVKIYMIFQLVPDFRFHSFETRSLFHAMYAEIFLNRLLIRFCIYVMIFCSTLFLTVGDLLILTSKLRNTGGGSTWFSSMATQC